MFDTILGHMDEAGGIIAYFGNEADAWFRLDYINRKMNG